MHKPIQKWKGRIEWEKTVNSIRGKKQSGAKLALRERFLLTEANYIGKVKDETTKRFKKNEPLTDALERIVVSPVSIFSVSGPNAVKPARDRLGELFDVESEIELAVLQDCLEILYKKETELQKTISEWFVDLTVPGLRYGILKFENEKSISEVKQEISEFSGKDWNDGAIKGYFDSILEKLGLEPPDEITIVRPSVFWNAVGKEMGIEDNVKSAFERFNRDDLCWLAQPELLYFPEEPKVKASSHTSP